MKQLHGKFRVRRTITDDRNGKTLAKKGQLVMGTCFPPTAHGSGFMFEPDNGEWIFNSEPFETYAAVFTLVER